MGGINFYKIPENHGGDKHIERKYRFLLNKQELSQIFDFLSTTFDVKRKSYIYGYGKQPASIYLTLQDDEGTDYKVIWHGEKVPKVKDLKTFLIRVAILISASTYGLIRFKSNNKIKQIMETLSSLAMVGYFSLPERSSVDLESSVIDHRDDLTFLPHKYVIKEEGFFYFIVDGDHIDENGNYLCRAAFGKDCPEALMRIIDFTERRR
jgi:hypothetical protein